MKMMWFPVLSIALGFLLVTHSVLLIQGTEHIKNIAVVLWSVLGCGVIVSLFIAFNLGQHNAK